MTLDNVRLYEEKGFDTHDRFSDILKVGILWFSSFFFPPQNTSPLLESGLLLKQRICSMCVVYDCVGCVMCVCVGGGWGGGGGNIVFLIYNCVYNNVYKLIQTYILTLVLLNPDTPCLWKLCRSRSVRFSEANWSGSALFVNKNFWICINNMDQVIWLAKT